MASSPGPLETAGIRHRSSFRMLDSKFLKFKCPNDSSQLKMKMNDKNARTGKKIVKDATSCNTSKNEEETTDAKTWKMMNEESIDYLFIS